METLREVLEQADSNAIALGHFNFSDLVTLKASFQVAHDLKASVIAGVSESEREFIGTRQAAALVKSLRDDMHGMLRTIITGETKKRLDIERIRAIKAEPRIFMTLHGASGTDDGDLRRAIAAGITVIHINTELRLAWRRGFDTALAREANEIVPYKVLSQVIQPIKEVVRDRMTLFTSGHNHTNPPPHGFPVDGAARRDPKGAQIPV